MYFVVNFWQLGPLQLHTDRTTAYINICRVIFEGKYFFRKSLNFNENWLVKFLTTPQKLAHSDHKATSLVCAQTQRVVRPTVRPRKHAGPGCLFLHEWFSISATKLQGDVSLGRMTLVKSKPPVCYLISSQKYLSGRRLVSTMSLSIAVHLGLD